MTTESQDRKRRRHYSRGAIVPEKDYVFLVLHALAAAGGRADRQRITDAVYPHVADRLRDYDRAPRAGTKACEPRWEHRVGVVRLKLRIAGLMRDDSPNGVWEITDEGRAHPKTGDLDSTWSKISKAFEQHRK
jgi:hypothetical protein